MGLVDRAKNILLTPKEEWLVIANEEPNSGAIITGYVVPLAILSAICSAVGSYFLTTSLLFSALGAVFGLIAAVLAVVIASAIVNALAPSFNSEKDSGRATQLVAYSYTAALVGGIFQIIPGFGGVLTFLASLYGIYLMYLGLPILMKTPEDKRVVYMIVAFVALIAVYMILTMIFAGIILGIVGVGVVAVGAAY